MKWIVNSAISDRFNNQSIITNLKVEATNISNNELRVLKVGSADISNGIFVFTLNELYMEITQSSYNNWKFTLKFQLNFNEEYIEIATCNALVTVSSPDISYFGMNVMLVDLSEFHWDGFIDLSNISKSYLYHLNDFRGMHSDGVSKTRISEYVGNELNVELHKQMT